MKDPSPSPPTTLTLDLMVQAGSGRGVLGLAGHVHVFYKVLSLVVGVCVDLSAVMTAVIKAVMVRFDVGDENTVATDTTSVYRAYRYVQRAAHGPRGWFRWGSPVAEQVYE